MQHQYGQRQGPRPKSQPYQDYQGNARTQAGSLMQCQPSWQAKRPHMNFFPGVLFPNPEEEHTLLAYKASADPDTMYMHKAMKEPGAG